MTQDDIAKFIEGVKKRTEGDVLELRGDKDILPHAMLLNPQNEMVLIGIASKEGTDKDALAYFLASQAHKHNAVAGAIVWTVWMAKMDANEPDRAPSTHPDREEAICIWEFNPANPCGHVARLIRSGNKARLEPWMNSGDSPAVGRFWDEILPIVKMNYARTVN